MSYPPPPRFPIVPICLATNIRQSLLKANLRVSRTIYLSTGTVPHSYHEEAITDDDRRSEEIIEISEDEDALRRPLVKRRAHILDSSPETEEEEENEGAQNMTIAPATGEDIEDIEDEGLVAEITGAPASIEEEILPRVNSSQSIKEFGVSVLRRTCTTRKSTACPITSKYTEAITMDQRSLEQYSGHQPGPERFCQTELILQSLLQQ